MFYLSFIFKKALTALVLHICSKDFYQRVSQNIWMGKRGISCSTGDAWNDWNGSIPRRVWDWWTARKLSKINILLINTNQASSTNYSSTLPNRIAKALVIILYNPLRRLLGWKSLGIRVPSFSTTKQWKVEARKVPYTFVEVIKNITFQTHHISWAHNTTTYFL